MHPLRIIVIVATVVAAAIAISFGAALIRAGTHTVPAVVIAAAIFVAYLLPAGAAFAWALRRAADLEELDDRVRRLAEGHYDAAIADRPFHGELDDLARGIEEVRDLVSRQEKSFAQQRAALEQIVSTVGEAIIGVDEHGRVVVANDRARDLFAVPQPVGRSFVEVVRRHSVVAALDKALRGEASTERMTVHSSDRGDRQYDVRVFPVTMRGEIAAVALFVDITTIERLQRVRKDFLDDFSHEVRTPLAGLRTAMETLGHADLPSDQELQLRQIMMRQLDRLQRLVKDLSELSSIEAGDVVLEKRNVDIRKMLADLCDEFRERTAGKPLRFTVKGEAAVGHVDPVRTQQIFTNLLDNAWKHGGERGEVVVDVGTDAGEVVVLVSDEGQGIPPEEIERIFHRFYRVDRSRSQDVPGLGLGLAITKHLVRLQGGSIRAYNAPDGGASFEVRLPAGR
jgi:two-component system phosphate regulon sensor histidine kinase PhoR